MFNNVIVGVDGRQGGREAIELAKILSAHDGELTLVHVYPVESPAVRGRGAIDTRDERDRARELLKRIRGEADVRARVQSVGASTVGRGLHEIAEVSAADLLVIGSSRRGLLGRVLATDHTRAALNGAPCAVAVAPAGYDATAMREVGVGYDGSPESEHALRVARTLAAEHTAKLSAFEAVAFPSYLFADAIATDDTTMREVVDAARERVAALDGVEPHAAYGQAAEELALYSASVDLLVIGSRGYGPIGRLVNGSTSHELARTARCPLLILARAGRTADGDRGTPSGREAADATTPAA